MSVVAIVREPREAARVVTWAARFAVARNTELIIFYWADPLTVHDEVITAEGEEEIADPTLRAVRQVVESVVRNRRARAGRLPRHLVSVLRISHPDPLLSTQRRVVALIRTRSRSTSATTVT